MPRSFCSGKVVFQDSDDFTLEDIIFLPENREFSEFRFRSDNGYALIDSEAGEIQIEHKGTDNVIPEETVRQMPRSTLNASGQIFCMGIRLIGCAGIPVI